MSWRAPDVVGVGVQKSGTSSVANFLRDSGMVFPRIAKSPDKELHWFKNTARLRTLRRNLYPVNFMAGGVRGEYTPNYIEHPIVLSQLRDAAPSAKIIVFLRDPVERTISSLNHARGIGKVPLGMEFRELIQKSWRGDGNGWISRAIRRGTYVADLENLLRLYPREQVFIGFFEDWVDAVTGLKVANNLARFVGLPPPEVSGAQIQPANTAMHHLSKVDGKPLRMEDETKAFLRDYFATFRPRLIDLIGPVPW